MLTSTQAALSFILFGGIVFLLMSIPNRKIPRNFQTATLKFEPKNVNDIPGQKEILLRFSDKTKKLVSSFTNDKTRKTLKNHITELLKTYSRHIRSEIEEITESLAPRCKPDCDGKNNTIFLTFDNKGGIGDRTSAIYFVSNLASYLCADLVVGRPCDLLWSSIKNQNSVDCGLEWEDFKKLRKHDGISVVRSVAEPILKRKELIEKSRSSMNLTDLVLQGSHSDLFEKAKSAFENSTRFTWHITENYYKWRSKMAAHFATNYRKYKMPYPEIMRRGQEPDELVCRNTLSYSDAVVKIASETLKTSDIKSDFISFHIRRGDARKECGTWVEKVEQYLNCSLANVDCFDKGQKHPVVLFTDEQSENYIRKIRMSVSKLGFEMVNGEDLVKTAVGKAISDGNLDRKFDNNFFLFEVGNYLKQIAKYKLALRRKISCHKCDPICGKTSE